MGFLKRIVSILGFLKGDNHDHRHDDARRHADGESSSDRADEEGAQCRRPGKGFSAQFPIAVDRAAAAAAHGPVLVQCNLGDCGVQLVVPILSEADRTNWSNWSDTQPASITRSRAHSNLGPHSRTLWYLPPGHPQLYTTGVLVENIGLQWYAKCLRIDEDGDVADEFLDEVLPEALRVEDQRQENYLPYVDSSLVL
ncbi:hypothetical protein ACLOJK_036880 [Asimina triloba]